MLRRAHTRNMIRKRPLLFIGSTLAFVLVAGGLYFLFSRNTTGLTVSDDPFGGIGSDFVDGGGLAESDAGAGEEVAPGLVRVTDRPVSEGVVAIDRVSTVTVPVETASGTPALQENVITDTEVRFIDRASGNIYRYTTHARSLTRLSNKTLPGIQKATWLADGSVAFVRFISENSTNGTIDSYVLPDNGEGGFFLEKNLAAAEATPAGTLFTMLSGTTGSVGSIARPDGTNPRTLFTSLLSAITVHPTKGSFFAYTKPSAFLNGYAFQINAATGSFIRILGPLAGLSVLPSPDGTKLLYSYVDRGTLRLSVYEVATRTTLPLPLATLTEKCSWAENGLSVYCGVPTALGQGLPDSWYQGVSPFSDRLWKISMQDRIATLIVDPSVVANISIDATALETDFQEDSLFFTDKNTGYLWVYDIP